MTSSIGKPGLQTAHESHTRAVFGSFKSSLQNKPAPLVRKSHITAVCGSFKSSLQNKPAPLVRKSHITVVCGSFKSFLLTSTHHQSSNPTSRQCVVRSSPFYSQKTETR